MTDPQKGLVFIHEHTISSDQLNISLDKLIVTKDSNLLYDQKIEMVDFSKQNPSDKSSEVSEKSPFLHSSGYVKVGFLKKKII